ncbi:uncharacterized protein CLUP02_13167 [Colletotrichum lupini]|uniref:Uncharacterized protein n=1 Tax=Colletotrichum lupini TaxID=145971 RepID=A0A9Q8T1S7_9PEZI|nr:uncharacterized protein CLUP02_13167 [Colletotrichum lupini]UQC87649.1 hypothetical protein CLUP02_13167 [Colletotrichum lupini]
MASQMQEQNAVPTKSSRKEPSTIVSILIRFGDWKEELFASFIVSKKQKAAFQKRLNHTEGRTTHGAQVLQHA